MIYDMVYMIYGMICIIYMIYGMIYDTIRCDVIYKITSNATTIYLEKIR